jgi:hypothetical protein
MFVALALSIFGGAVLYRYVESKRAVLGVNVKTALLLAGITATFILESLTAS